MPYDEKLAERVRKALVRRKEIVEKKLFGGVGFLLQGNMCVGVWKEYLIPRIGIEQYQEALSQDYVKEFDITGRPMRGWVMVAPEGIRSDEDLANWITMSMAFTSQLPPK